MPLQLCLNPCTFRAPQPTERSAGSVPLGSTQATRRIDAAAQPLVSLPRCLASAFVFIVARNMLVRLLPVRACSSGALKAATACAVAGRRSFTAFEEASKARGRASAALRGAAAHAARVCVAAGRRRACCL